MPIKKNPSKTEILTGYQNTPLHGAACLPLLSYIMKLGIFLPINMSYHFLITLYSYGKDKRMLWKKRSLKSF